MSFDKTHISQGGNSHITPICRRKTITSKNVIHKKLPIKKDFMDTLLSVCNKNNVSIENSVDWYLKNIVENQNLNILKHKGDKVNGIFTQGDYGIELEFNVDSNLFSNAMKIWKNNYPNRPDGALFQSILIEISKEKFTEPKPEDCSKPNSINNLKQGFKEYLIANGYKEYTSNGQKSTVYQYIDAIEDVIYREMLDLNNTGYKGWELVKECINDCIYKYGENGSEREFGKRGHDTVINALRRYKEFIRGKDKKKNIKKTFIVTACQGFTLALSEDRYYELVRTGKLEEILNIKL